eukprot:767013-Hanusia_phi.AAC.1
MEISVKLNTGLQSMRSTSSTWNKQRACKNFKMQILGKDIICSAKPVRSDHLARICELLRLQHPLQGDIFAMFKRPSLSFRSPSLGSPAPL